ncbi:endolytic transglycosylase MltG [Microbacterium marmarense]|uniref:Endolytic murein transglycosylase n=1 Tax=Microbacterium marmarense TaxID=3122051 RepID=A0ABU8LU81_9MICO
MSDTPTPGPADGAAPVSRRAAREAAAREAAPAKAPDGAPEPPPTAAPVRASTESNSSDDSWIFGTPATRPTASPSYNRAGNAASARTSSAQNPTDPTPRASTATLDDLFSAEATADALGTPPPPGNRRKRRIGGWIALAVFLLLIGGAAVATWYVWSTYESQIREVMGWEEPQDYEEGLATGETFVTISEGDTGSPISQSLYDAGVTKTPEAFYDYLIDTGQNPNFVPGVFAMQQQMTSEAALAALMNPENKMENSAQLREGLTVEDSLPLLAEGIGLPLEDLEAAVKNPADYGVEADTLEGWLFPATYSFDPGVTAEEVIQRLVNRTITSLDAAEVPVDQRQEILTIASIIQREARYEEDMRKVATVIENRLQADNQETFGYLQMDSTAQYGFGEDDGTASTSADAQYDDNPWNTYVNPGLPVGPIANPGDVAIAAAMDPAEGDWLYFVTVNLNTGETTFTTNLNDHNAAVNDWLSWCSENPDAGC